MRDKVRPSTQLVEMRLYRVSRIFQSVVVRFIVSTNWIVASCCCLRLPNLQSFVFRDFEIWLGKSNSLHAAEFSKLNNVFNSKNLQGGRAHGVRIRSGYGS